MTRSDLTCNMCGSEISDARYGSFQLIEDVSPCLYDRNKHVQDLCERCGNAVKDFIKSEYKKVKK